jgi:hypothetical protein
MTRNYVGWKEGVGAVIRIVASDAHDPKTHPKSDFGAFRIDTETAAIGYGDHRGTQTVVPLSLQWLPDQWYDNWIGGQVLARTQAAGGNPNNGVMSLFANPGGIWPDLNAFYFVTTQDTAWKQAWSSFGAAYLGSSDRYNVTRRGPTERYQQMIVPVKTNGGWSAAGYGYLDPQSTATDVNAPPQLTRDLSTVPGVFMPIANMPVRTYSFYGLDLPVDESPYPAVPPGPPTQGLMTVYFNQSLARMSKAGYDIRTANFDQLIFDSAKLPMKVIKTGLVGIAQGGVVGIPLGAAYDPSIFVDYLVQAQGASYLWLPAWPENPALFYNVQYRINGSTLELYNTSSTAVWVRYVVMAADSLAPSVGTNKVFDRGLDYLVIRRPGSAGTRLKDTIVDSRLSYLPIVQQAWVPFSSFADSGGHQAGTHYWATSWANPGNFKPYVLAKVARQNKNNPAQIVYQDFYGKFLEISSQNRFSDSTFMCQLTDTSATFFASNGGRWEDAWSLDGGAFRGRSSSYQTIGIRYYVFAIPTNL